MALATTTLSSAATASAKEIVVASATSVAAGRLVLVDQEMMQVVQSYVSGTTVGVLRGRGGTAAVAHVASANVVHGASTDFSDPGAQTVVSYPAAGWSKKVISYSAAGAIALPKPHEDTVVVINGTDALAMTLAVPTDDLDGCELFVIANGKAAHTVTAAGGFGLASTSYDVATSNANGQCGLHCIAANGAWVILSSMTGTLTNFVPAIA